MFAKYASAASSSAFVTFALLLVMQSLIALQPGAESEPRTRFTLDSFIPKMPDSPLQREEIIQKDDLTKAEPEPPRERYTGGKETIHVPRSIPTPPISTGLLPVGQFTDGPLVAMVRVAPVYPARAIAQEIEGYVVIEFDVTSAGYVVNAVVVESSNHLFDKEAIKAAEKIRFKPRIVDGVAQTSYGIQNLFRFSLDDR